MQDGPEPASQKCPSTTAAMCAPPDPRASVSGTTWLRSQGFYIQTMSRRALFPAAVGGGFRTVSMTVPPIAPSRPDLLLQEGNPGKPSRPGPQTQTTDHGCPWAPQQPTSSILGRVRGSAGCSSTTSHNDGGTRTTPNPPGSTPPEQNKMGKETQTQAQKDIEPNIYTKYYSF